MERQSDWRLHWFIVLIVAMTSFVSGYKLSNRNKPPIPQADTIRIERWDTCYVEKPTEIVRYINRFDTIRSTDTTIQIVVDTIFSTPTAIIPIESAIYKESLKNAKYEAFLSGYKAQLDSIRIECLNTETTIRIKEPPRRLGIGVQVGIGATKQGFSPYFGIGAHYRLW